MERKEIEKKVNDTLVKVFDVKPEQCTPDAMIGNDLGFDSIDAVELSIELDKEFGIDIKDDDFYQMLDDSCLLTHVYDMVEDYVKKKG